MSIDNNQPNYWNQLETDYKIGQLLGKGSFGTVHKALHLATGHDVAIKLIQFPKQNQHHLRQCLREILILRKLTEDENNIFTTTLLDVVMPEGVIDNEKGLFDLNKLDHIFLVMDLGERDLNSLLKSHKSLELDEEHVLTIMYNILCALNFFHSANIIHRDIKPGNILIDSNCAIKICDFGLARVLPKKSDLEQKLQDFKNINMSDICSQQIFEKRHSRLDEFKKEMSGHLNNTKQERAKKERDMTCGIQSRWYRAPEIILTDINYDKSVDIWGAGVILAELLKVSSNYTSQRQNGTGNFKYHMYPGQSCYPISPVSSKDNTVSETDQIFKVLKTFSNLDVQDFSFISCPNGQGYVKSLTEQVTSENSIEEQFNKSSDELQDLLKQMLELNPYYRPSANQLLKLGIFDGHRMSKNEKRSKYKTVCKFDQTNPSNYSQNKPNQENDKKVTKALLVEIIKEFKKFQKANKS